MAYGFKLGVISGLSRDIPVLNITLNNGTSNTYTVSYFDGVWRDDVEEPNIILGIVEETNECGVILTALTSEDVGDEYTINLSLPEAPTQSFADAVHMVVGSGGGAKTIIYVSQSDLMNYSSGHIDGYKDEEMTTQFDPGEITVESDLVVYCVYNDEIMSTFVPFTNMPAAGGTPGMCFVLVPGQNGVSAIPVQYYDGK